MSTNRVNEPTGTDNPVDKPHVVEAPVSADGVYTHPVTGEDRTPEDVRAEADPQVQAVFDAAHKEGVFGVKVSDEDHSVAAEVARLKNK